MIHVHRRAWALLALSATLTCQSALAHHSFAMFDRKVLAEISGTVKDLQWTNPHVYLDVVSEDDAGVTTTWTFEAGAPLQLENAGLKKTAIKPGDKVTVYMHPLKSGAPGGELATVIMADGHEFKLDQGAPPPPKAQ